MLQPHLTDGETEDRGCGGNSWELVGELDCISGSAVCEHGYGLTVGPYGMARGCLASVSLGKGTP